MIDYKQLNRDMLESIDPKPIRTNKKITYLNIESAFDIETTSIKLSDGSKSAFMYIFMFGIGHGNGVYYGRTWQEFKELCELIQKVYDLSEDRRLIVYVHNLGYEFQFMRKHFEWLNVFSIDERKPIKALCSYGIEFRDSYILSGYSLAKTAENLVSHDIKKLTGDLDYSLVRTKDTVMSPDELAYCNNDIEIITAYINEQIEQYQDITKIPLTNTGRVRSYVRNECYYTSKNHRKSNKGKYSRYRKVMNDLTLHPSEYKRLKRSFMGGFTHANTNHVGKTLNDVSSVDFTSSYPATMLSEQYPMSRGRIIKVENITQLDKYSEIYCLVFDVKFTGIRSKIIQENYISESKCITKVNAVINNGRVFSADEITMTITNVDYDIIKQCYDYDGIEVANVTRYHKGYLPKSIITAILKLYGDKTQLKGVAGKEVEYLLSKGMLNSVYGMCVTDIVKDEHTYTEDWDVSPADIGEQVTKYNESKSRFLFYAWGIFVTAYSRKNLWTGIIALGDDYVYSDTDSIKLLNLEKHADYFNWYNNNVVTKLNLMCEHYSLDPKLLKPKTIKGEEKMLGVWDYEGTYNRFKTLGAKRYLTEKDGYFELTVAGLSKRNGIEYMKRKADSDPEKVFKMFNDELYVPAEETGKMTHTYIDHKQEYMLKDYQGNETYIVTESGVHLESCEFTLSISKQYGKFISEFLSGNLYKGVKYV